MSDTLEDLKKKALADLNKSFEKEENENNEDSAR